MEEEDQDQNSDPIPYQQIWCALLQYSGKITKEAVEILQQFDEKAIVSIRSVQRFFKQSREEGHHETNYHKNGNTKFNQEDRQMIIEAFSDNPKLTIQKAAKQEDINPQNISKSQIRTILIEEGFNAYRVPKVFPLNENQKEDILKFCLKRERWTNNWSHILFRDECQIQSSAMGKNYLCFQNKDYIQPEHCDINETYPMKIMVWAVISHLDGPLLFKKIEGTINKEKYIETLEEFFEECQEFIYNDTIFQYDNASSHKAKLVESWFQAQNIKISDLPANSTDLSPIENISLHLKDHLYQSSEYSNEEEIYLIVKQYFSNSDKIKEAIKNSYDLLSKRMKQVIQNYGDIISI